MAGSAGWLEHAATASSAANAAATSPNNRTFMINLLPSNAALDARPLANGANAYAKIVQPPMRGYKGRKPRFAVLGEKREE